MKQLLKLIYLLFLIANPEVKSLAQNDSVTRFSGIRWIDDLSWQQVNEKARVENKYIFIDCYTTWCGPCKRMDREVYSNKTVGELFNDKFISIKVQMDKTKKDNEFIKSWYSDAIQISKKYRVDGYPSFIFLSPQGVVAHMEKGYKGVDEFIRLAKLSTLPGKKYDDPYKEYDSLAREYRLGNKNYEEYPLMIKMAFKLKDMNFGKQLWRELNDYVLTLTPDKRYTKERIELWSGIRFTDKSPVFGFFYSDGKLIDRVMKMEGYAKEQVDKNIQYELVEPFFAEQKKSNMTSMYLSGPGLKADYTEADWKKLEEMVRDKYGVIYVKRNILKAKVNWYKRNRNFSSLIKYGLIHLEKYPQSRYPAWVNNLSFYVFLYSNEKKVIKRSIRMMEEILRQSPNNTSWIDTYANLLYKIGRKDDAVRWEIKAANLSGGNNSPFYKIVEKMKCGEPTYKEKGAIWK